MKELIESLHESEGWDTTHLFLKFWYLEKVYWENKYPAYIYLF